MAQEENYIAIVSQRLSKPGDTRYVIIDKQTQQEVDTCNGRGYKSAQAAHKSFAFKMRRQQQSERARQMRSQYQAGASRPSAASGQRLSLTSRFSPQRWTSQENTPRPSDLFDFTNK
jgi:hypothetical protein